jgi:NAD(P)-dependent dehydrogenase (short-subunit alcohol dehydrogenase family)
MSLKGKVALVTGGTGALGSVIVARMIQEGARVSSSYRSDQERSHDTASGGQLPSLFKADVTVEQDVAKLFAGVLTKFGRLDVLVNTVGGFVPGKTVAQTSVEDWDTMMALNLRSNFLCTREALRTMKGQSYGRIVSIAAMTALKPGAGKSAYAISKAGVVMLTEIAAQEVKGSGITVNAIAPSIILTKANVDAMPDEDSRSWVKPEDIAEAICYLCTDSAGSITGTTLRAFGGV